jgi:hypothetical protein
MAVKMQAEYGDDLRVVFVEVQGASRDDVERFALKHEWFGTNGMWTTERPVVNGARGIPNFVLLSSDGEVVLQGHPLSMHKEIEAFVERDRRQREAVPDGMPRQLAAAWKAFARGKLGEAVEAADKVAPVDDVALADAADRLRERIRRRAAAVVDRAERMVDEGCYAEAKDLARRLAKDFDGLPDAQRAEALLARIDGDELADEIRAETLLRRIEKRLFTNGPDRVTTVQLERLSRKHGATKAGLRADRLVQLTRDG